MLELVGTTSPLMASAVLIAPAVPPVGTGMFAPKDILYLAEHAVEQVTIPLKVITPAPSR